MSREQIGFACVTEQALRLQPWVTAQEHRCLSESGDCLRPGSAYKLLLASPGLAFVTHSFVQLKFTSNLGQLFLVVVNQCTSPLQHGMTVVLTSGSLTPCVDHSPTPPVGHSKALHLFCFQFPHKWLWGHLGPMYEEGNYSPSLPGPWAQRKQLSLWLRPLPIHVWKRDIYLYSNLDCFSFFLEY